MELPIGSGYVLVSTGVFNGNAYPILSSTDLVNWKEVPVKVYCSSSTRIDTIIERNYQFFCLTDFFRKVLSFHLVRGQLGLKDTCGLLKYTT